jgi:SAM-dependent methyltransferase
MVDIYTKPELYDAIHQAYSSDKNLITSIAEKAGGPVLELASGTGRLAQLILDLGLDYTGIDSSVEFLKSAIHEFGDRATFHQNDMRQFELDQKFNFIFIGFNSFLHNLTDEDANQCLQSVFNHLTNGGTFLVSTFIPDPSFLYREKGKQYPATSPFNFDGSRCRIMETNEYEEETQINQLTWQLERDGTLEPEKYHYRMRMFYPHMMDILLSDAGLRITEKMGDYDGSPMDEESGMQIYVCTKD